VTVEKSRKGRLFGGMLIGLIIVLIGAVFVIKTDFLSKFSETTTSITKTTKTDKAITSATKEKEANKTTTSKTEKAKTDRTTTLTTKPTKADKTKTSAKSTETKSPQSTPDISTANDTTTDVLGATANKIYIDTRNVFFFWKFKNRVSAEGFKNELKKKSGIPLLIEQTPDDQYRVGFEYLDQEDIVLKTERIEEAGGIKINELKKKEE